jgi:uncharacterized repeat protein (TIGR01451 family)
MRTTRSRPRSWRTRVAGRHTIRPHVQVLESRALLSTLAQGEHSTLQDEPLDSRLVSINAGGTAAGDDFSGTFGEGSQAYSISADGRYIAFTSFASDLTSLPDNNGGYDVFRRDLLTGVTTLVSVNAAGTAAGNRSSETAPAISADGRYVAFASFADDLTATPDTNNRHDMFVRDMETGTTTLVSVDRDGNAAGIRFSDSQPAVMSANGRIVAFVSEAANITAVPDTNNASDVFVRDVVSGMTVLISANASASSTGDGASRTPSLSASGLLVAYESEATDLAFGVADTNGTVDVYVAFLGSGGLGENQLVSINTGGTDSGNDYARTPFISADGLSVAFESAATNLTTLPDTNGGQDVFVRDLGAQTTMLASVNAGGTAAANSPFSFRPSLSSDGRLVAFLSRATDLTTVPDTNDAYDVFVRDLVAGSTRMLSENAEGTAAANGNSQDLALSADGRYVAFTSTATDLTTISDTNGATDVFVREVGSLTPAPATLLSVNADGAATGGLGSYGPAFSGDGNTVAFLSEATDLTTISDANNKLDLFTTTLVAPPQTSAEVALTNTANVATAQVGQELTFTINVSNGGPALAAGVQVIDTLPADVEFVRSDPAGSLAGRTLSFALADLAAGASRTLQITVRPTADAAGTELVNKVTSISTTDDPVVGNNTDVLSPAVFIVIPSTDTVAPTVAELRRIGYHFQPTRLVLTFSEGLDPARAGDLAQYRLVGSGRDGRLGTSDDRAIALRSVLYDASKNTVVLRPRRQLSLFRTYRLTVSGATPSGVTDLAGNLLDGDGDGRPGGDYVARINRRLLDVAATKAQLERARANNAVPQGPLAVSRPRRLSASRG